MIDIGSGYTGRSLDIKDFLGESHPREYAIKKLRRMFFIAYFFTSPPVGQDLISLGFIPLIFSKPGVGKIRERLIFLNLV